MDTPKRVRMTSKEAADYLGYSLSYFRKLMMKRAVPMYKPGGRKCFFYADELDQYVERSRIASQSEIEAEAADYLANRTLNSKRHG